ncbi:hypothetical protein [Krasilnikovia sp. MM14-A1259]|uniref:hypothetical protein n=1 Tax=Krasilnikovia sp. MM14-A1259 TaxID=3373539 RepID=UPI00399CCED9
MSEESTPSALHHSQDAWPAPDGIQPAPESAPPTGWAANSGMHQQWSPTVSGPPAQGGWSSGQPQQWDVPPVQPQSGAAWSTQPQSGAGWDAPASPYPSEPMAQNQPRITPTPRKQRSPLLPWIAGLTVAVLAAGAGGYFLGAATGGGVKKDKDPDPAPPAATGLYDAQLASVNKTKLNNELAGLAQPWLNSTLGACMANTDKGAPPLGNDETRHVTCKYGSVGVQFVVYKNADAKNASRLYRQQMNINSDAIAPGVHDPARINGGVTGAPGKVIEYAFRAGDGRSVCGMSWERDDAPLAIEVVESYCEEDFGGKWEPLRDLWQRHS